MSARGHHGLGPEAKPREFISALLLAAGESQRMGRPKQLLPLGESTLIEVALENLLRSRLQEVIVVLGFMAEEIRPRVETKGVRVAVNPHYKEGMASSLRVGLEALDPRAGGILVALADQPFIPPEVIDRLIEAFQRTSKGIVVPVFQGRRGHPVIFHRRYEEELRCLSGDQGGRELLQRKPGELLEVDVDCPGVLQDIDTLEDYRRLCP